jgi:hypothetical protein
MTMEEIIAQRMMRENSLMPDDSYEGEYAQMRSKVPTPETTASPQSSGISEVGDMATAGGMASANPYVAGAGIALKGIGMVDSAKRQQEQAKIDAYNRKIMAQRAATRNIFA